MTIWLFGILCVSVGGGLIVLHNAARTKQSSEEMLKKYAEMLADAREEKLKALTEGDDNDDESGE